MFDSTTPYSAPQVVPVPTMAPPPSVVPPTQPRSHKKIWRTLFLVVLVAAAGVGAAYYFFVLAVTPEKVMGKMWTAMSGVTSTEFGLEVTGTGMGMVDGKGDAPRHEAELVMALMANGAFAYLDNLFAMDFSLHTTADSETVFGFAGASRSVGGADYIKLTEVPKTALPIDTGDFDAMSVLRDRWIVIDRAEIAKSLHLEQFFAQLDSQTAGTTTSHADAVKAVFATYLPAILHVTATLPTEDIGGVSSFHYAYTIDEAAVRTLESQLQIALGDDLQQGSFDKIDAFLDSTENLQGEMWIAKATSYVTKVTMTGDVMQKSESSTFTDKIAFTVALTLSNPNATISVEAPSDATPIIDVMKEVMEKVMEFTTADDDGDGLTNINETKHNTDPANSDTDGDGFSDGDEVKGGYNPLGEGKMPVEIQKVEFGD